MLTLTPNRMLLLALTSTLMGQAIASGGRGMTTWRNSSVGIHAFLTFDGSASPDAIQEFAQRIDYGQCMQ